MAFSTAIDEKKLIEDLQRESTAHKAFELLMRTFSEPLYWQIRKMVYNHDDANDLLQNVFLKAWNNIHNFRGDAKLSTWLYKIAVNEAINFINREKNRQSISADTDDTSFLLDNLEADDYFDGDELQADLLKEIAKLPEKQRLVFNMKYFDEMKYEEISDILGTSVGALKASYHHAVKKLTKAFGLAVTIGMILLTAISAMAVPASPDLRMHVQPDGSVIEFRIFGDENDHYMTDVNGMELLFDEEGFLRPAAEIPGAITRATRAIDTRRKFLISGSSFPSEGSPKALVVLVRFRERFFSMTDPQEYYTRMLNEEGFSDHMATGSVRDFFVENSMGKFTPQFDVYGPVGMSKSMDHYGMNDRYGNDMYPHELVIEALTKLDDEVDFSQYDTDGDGVIDNVYVFYAGYGEQDAGTSTLLWPHSADIVDFNLGEDYYFDGKLLNRYAMSNELKANTTTPDGIGTFVHEFSHVLGIPDLYSTIYSRAFTPGRYSTLDMACYNNFSRTPAYYSLFERMSVGWATPMTIDGDGEYELLPIQESNTGYIIPTENQDEFYLLENRQLVGSDEYIPGHGMLVWHIDFNQRIWDDNFVNNDRFHQYVDIVEADNNPTDLSRGGDPFPGTGTIRNFGFSTIPSLRSWADKELSVNEISNINEHEDWRITFTVKGSILGIDSVAASEANGPVFAADGSLINRSYDIPAEIFDAAGRKVAILSPGQSASLPRGIYIARTSASSQKIFNK